MAKMKTSRVRRTKAEIQEEFDLLSKEQKVELSEKSDEALKREEASIREAVQDVDADTVVRKITELNLEVSKNFGTIAEKLVAEVRLLSQLRQAVALEKEELERFHKKDIALLAVDQLIEEYETRKKAIKEEIATLEVLNKEYEEGLKKTRAREMDEYNYKLAMERKKAQDKYEEEVRLRERVWKERESALKEQEEEVAGLRKQVEEFPAHLKLEIEKAVAEAIRQTKVQHAEELMTMKYSSETDKKLSELKAKTLEEAVTQYLNQIQVLQKQTDDAKKQVQEIAVKAIEGASGAKALNHVSQIALEQAKIK